jgi:hypothetical protein
MEKLIEILEIPTVTHAEIQVQKYLKKWAAERNIAWYEDETGNIYFTKGKPGKNLYFPCLVSHMDTVHEEQIFMAFKGIKKVIQIEYIEDKTILRAVHPETGKKLGIGGDPLAGVFICLQLIEKLPDVKAAFFIAEEIGMKGSKKADWNFFKDVGYSIQFDAPQYNWVCKYLFNTPLASENFFNALIPLFKSFDITNFTSDPFTDALQIRLKTGLANLVLPCGYYLWHTEDEYVIYEETLRCVELGEAVLNFLGNKRYQ